VREGPVGRTGALPLNLAHGAKGRIVTGRQGVDDKEAVPKWVWKARRAMRWRPEMARWAAAEELAWHRADALAGKRMIRQKREGE
jgi:hypothetical protein